MFTGIVEELGTIVAADETAVGDERAVRLTIEGALVSSDVVVGDSIAVSGVCLTVVDAASGRFPYRRYDGLHPVPATSAGAGDPIS